MSLRPGPKPIAKSTGKQLNVDVTIKKLQEIHQG